MAIAAGADALGLVSVMPSGGNDIPAFGPPAIGTALTTAEMKAQAISAHIRATNPTAVQIVAHY